MNTFCLSNPRLLLPRPPPFHARQRPKRVSRSPPPLFLRASLPLFSHFASPLNPPARKLTAKARPPFSRIYFNSEIGTVGEGRESLNCECLPSLASELDPSLTFANVSLPIFLKYKFFLPKTNTFILLFEFSSS